MNFDELTLDINQQIDMKAPPHEVFQSVLHRLGEGNVRPDGVSQNMLLEAWAGGRWYRDRGNGIGHLWGHVQAIKPGELLELSGPMFMSYPALNHVEVKLEPIPAGTRLSFRHRALGLLDPAHKEGVKTGWASILENIRTDSEKAAAVHA